MNARLLRCNNPNCNNKLKVQFSGVESKPIIFCSVPYFNNILENEKLSQTKRLWKTPWKSQSQMWMDNTSWDCKNIGSISRKQSPKLRYIEVVSSIVLTVIELSTQLYVSIISKSFSKWFDGPIMADQGPICPSQHGCQIAHWKIVKIIRS